jgi:hypothetical protein
MDKISETYRRRLMAMQSGQPSRAIVVVKSESPPRSLRSLTERQRKRALTQIRKQAEGAVHNIDDVLARYGGKRLRKSASNLGTILVEAPPDAIIALGKLEQVEAILEDQPVKQIDLNQ